MVNNNNNINLIAKENFKQVAEVREIENQIPSYEEFLKGYESDGKVDESYNFEVDSYKDIRVEKKFGLMPLHRDVTLFEAKFPKDRASAWLYQDNLFQKENGIVDKKLSLRGINEMKEALKKLEEGKLWVVKARVKDDGRIEYLRVGIRQEELKEALREKIASLENDYSYEDENDGKNKFLHTFQGKLIQE
jgi:hypothetical protein